MISQFKNFSERSQRKLSPVVVASIVTLLGATSAFAQAVTTQELSTSTFDGLYLGLATRQVNKNQVPDRGGPKAYDSNNECPFQTQPDGTPYPSPPLRIQAGQATVTAC